MRRTVRKIEFGDFQTPDELAAAACRILVERGACPRTIIEPTCGTGTVLLRAAKSFPEATHLLGLEINKAYFEQARRRADASRLSQSIDLRGADFFSFDWSAAVSQLPKPILVIGNLPWVTSSQLGAINGQNLPEKSNFQQLRGLDARTGKSNFDIAEWMMIRLLEIMGDQPVAIAMLLKSSVVRRLLSYAWSRQRPVWKADFYRFDAQRWFGASVDAGLFVCEPNNGPAEPVCSMRELDAPQQVSHHLSIRGNELTPDSAAFDATGRLSMERGNDTQYRWRSGVKHDCGPVLELRQTSRGLVNGLGEHVDVEEPLVYPPLKGSAIAADKTVGQSRYILLPQRSTSEETAKLRQSAPKAWGYLKAHCENFAARRSSIYRGRPEFSIFGVGPYTFDPWKVAICGLYKRLKFLVVGPRDGRPTVFDDTVYFLSCKTELEANLLFELLQLPAAHDFFEARLFWDAKRPITAQLLNRLSIRRLAEEAGKAHELAAASPRHSRGSELSPMLF